MSGKHTEGPWCVVGPSSGNPNMGLWSVEGATNVANNCTLADARLIATALETLTEFKALYKAYVGLIEAGRDRIIAFGGNCDPVDVMEAHDPALISARAALAKAEGRTA